LAAARRWIPSRLFRYAISWSVIKAPLAVGLLMERGKSNKHARTLERPEVSNSFYFGKKPVIYSF